MIFRAENINSSLGITNNDERERTDKLYKGDIGRKVILSNEVTFLEVP